MNDRRYHAEHVQPCWSCRNYLGGCAWTRVDPDTGRVCFDPVPGWEAIPRERLSNGAMDGGLMIISCPQYCDDGTGGNFKPHTYTNESVMELFRQGKSCREVAEITGMSRTNASYYYSKFVIAGLVKSTRPPGRPRERSPWTAEQVLELFRAGRTCSQVARETGMNISTAKYYRKKFRLSGDLDQKQGVHHGK